MNAYELLNRQAKATKLANMLEPLMLKQSLPISLLEDVRSAEWWMEVARQAKVNPPSLETRAMVVRMLYDRQKARMAAK